MKKSGSSVAEESHSGAMKGVNLVKAEKVKRGRVSWKEHKIFTGIFVGIGVLLVGLVVAIIVIVITGSQPEENCVNCEGDTVVVKYESEEYGGELRDAMAMAIFSNAVAERLQSDDSYVYADAIRDFDVALEDADADSKLLVATYYAYFVYEQTEDVNMAIGVLDTQKPLAFETERMIQYYGALAGIYDAAGMAEESEDYYNKVNQLTEQVTEEAAALSCEQVEE